MKMHSKFLIAILASFLAVGCSNDDDSNDNPADSCQSNIPFMQTGKSFTYKTTQFGFDAGTMKFSIGNCNGSGFLVSREVRDASNVLVASSSGTDLWKQEGDYILTDSNNNGDYFAKIYKKNATLNDTWQYNRPSDGAVINYTVVDLDSLITVPVGQFHCKVFKYTNSSTINDSYIFWDDQIGQIKEDAGFFQIELKAYN